MKQDILRRVPFFSALSDEQLEHVADALTLKEFAQGEVLLEEDASGDLMFILVDGEVEVLKSMGTKSERLLGVRGPGTLLGEMSLFSEGKKHTASVRALSSIQVFLMSKTDLDDLLQRHPTLAYDMLTVLSRRLNESENLTILDLQEKNKALAQAYEELKAAQEQLVEKERLERELEVARQIQMSILPRSYPLISGYDFGATVIPMTAVGGDFYDFINLGDERVGIAIGDVTDHGVPSALLMALTVTLLRAESRRESSPRDVLLRINRHLLEMDETGMFVTLLYGILDCPSGGFTYARAGHEIPILFDARGRAIDLQHQKGQPVGLFEDPLLDEQQLELPSGAMLFLYSDGAVDAINENGVRYGLDNLCKALKKRRKADAKIICESVWKSLTAYRGGALQQDDVTMLAIRTE